MQKPKAKTLSHIIESESIRIIQSKIPKYWTIHDYKPDYGIDFVIEIFEKNGDLYTTLGEHLFIQAKGVETASYGTIKANEINSQVIKFNIDISELLTVKMMSPALPVLLFVIEISSSRLFYLCLNDYIEIFLKNTDLTEMKTKTLYIPLRNELANDNDFKNLMLYSKRPKLYALFISIAELKKDWGYSDAAALFKRYKNDLKYILQNDAWSLKTYWAFLDCIYSDINAVIEKGYYLSAFPPVFDNEERLWEIPNSAEAVTRSEANLYTNLISIIEQMSNMVTMYEVYARNWNLPTWLGEITSE